LLFSGELSYPENVVKPGTIATLAGIAFIASLTVSDAQAQGFTFGAPASDDHVRAGTPARVGRKARAQARHCRSERHQVYDARGQLIWRTIQVCG
jgi:hypothetical protein